MYTGTRVQVNMIQTDRRRRRRRRRRPSHQNAAADRFVESYFEGAARRRCRRRRRRRRHRVPNVGRGQRRRTSERQAGRRRSYESTGTAIHRGRTRLQLGLGQLLRRHAARLAALAVNFQHQHVTGGPGWWSSKQQQQR